MPDFVHMKKHTAGECWAEAANCNQVCEQKEDDREEEEKDRHEHDDDENEEEEDE